MTDGPEAKLDSTDPGDETQNRYRYQHAYGVILLIAALRKEKAYVALWCEHWEDYLAEKDNGQFDSYQVKTREPDLGSWKIKDEALAKSIGRFVHLDKMFPGHIDHHHFASNLRPYNSSQAKELPKCPQHIIDSVRGVQAAGDLPADVKKVVDKLAEECDTTVEELMSTLRRVKLIKGPGKDDYDSVLAQMHIPHCDGCANLTPSQLSGVRDEMIHAVYRASSVAIDDPSVHVVALNDRDKIKPRLLAKRIIVADFAEQMLSNLEASFRFTPAGGVDGLSTQGGDHKSALEQKLVEGGLGDYQKHLNWRAMSAERHLLELAAKDPEQADRLADQLSGVVQGVCLDAHALASIGPEPWGPAMYKLVVERLSHINQNTPDAVLSQSMDCTMGVAGLLTDECTVWWSPVFDLEKQS